MSKKIDLPDSWKSKPVGYGTAEDAIAVIEGVVLAAGLLGFLWKGGRDIWKSCFEEEEEAETLTPFQVIRLMDSYDGMSKKERKALKKRLMAMCRD